DGRWTAREERPEKSEQEKQAERDRIERLVAPEPGEVRRRRNRQRRVNPGVDRQERAADRVSRRSARELAGKVGSHEREADLQDAVPGTWRGHPLRELSALFALRQRARHDASALDQGHVGVDL